MSILTTSVVSTTSRQLTSDEWDILNAIEQLYYIDGEVPSVERVVAITSLPKELVEKTLRDALVIESLANRGINIGRAREILSTEQLAAAAVFFDTKDGRSLKKKLNDIGVTTQQWDAWKREPLFGNYLREVAERTLQSNIAETEVALMDSAHRGDISAIKLHLELAGRWSSKTVGELNVEFLLMKILEAVQKHVQTLPGGSEAVENIAAELLALAPRQNQPAISSGGAVHPVGDF